MKNNKGFSLVELIVVIAIMAILAAVAIPTFASFIEKANVASDKQFVDDLKYSITLANTVYDDDATLTAITVDASGMDEVTYTVGDVTVVIDVAAKTADATKAENSTTSDAKVAEIEKAAADVIASMDWTYNFKSKDYKAGYPIAENNNG